MTNQSRWCGSSGCRALRKTASSLTFGALLAGALLCPLAGSADNADLIKGNQSVTMPSPLPQNKNTDTTINCAQTNRDARCRQPTSEHHSYPYTRRPIIINSTPAPAPIDIDARHDDWEGCRATKLDAIHSRSAGNLDQANRLDEWLWKNCRSYSEELRDLEQNQM